MDDGMGVQLFYLSWAVMGGPVTGDYKRDVSPAKKMVRTMDKQFCVVGRCPQISGICGLMVATDQLPYRIHGVSGCKSSSRPFYQWFPASAHAHWGRCYPHDTSWYHHPEPWSIYIHLMSLAISDMRPSSNKWLRRTVSFTTGRESPAWRGNCAAERNWSWKNACQDLIQSPHRLWRTLRFHHFPTFPSSSPTPFH